MEKCSAITRKGKQCRNSVVAETKFCNTHSNQNNQNCLSRNLVLRYLEKGGSMLIILIGLIGTIVGLKADRNSFQDKRQNATSGVIISSKNTLTKNILIGSTRFLINNNDGVLVYDNEDPLLSVKTKDNKLLVSTSIRDKEGHLLAELKDNNWTHQVKPFIFDRNYNDNTLEIRDNTGKIVLQVLNFGDAIQFAAIFRCRNGKPVAFLPDEDGMSIITPPLAENARVEIKPICEYPSDSNLGVCPGFADLEKLSRITLKSKPYELTDKGSFKVCS
jgi:hypothetical protein